MKTMRLFSLILVSVFLAGCSSSEPTAPNTRTAANSGNQAVNIQDNTGPATGDANVYPLKEAGNNSLPVNGPANKNTKDPKTQSSSRPAPDDSQIYSELTDVPTETRVFNSHPLLLKVVKTGMPPNQKVKIYVKGGKVIELPGDKIPNMVASAATIVREAGLTMPEAPAQPRGETKKVDQKQ